MVRRLRRRLPRVVPLVAVLVALAVAIPAQAHGGAVTWAHSQTFTAGPYAGVAHFSAWPASPTQHITVQVVPLNAPPGTAVVGADLWPNAGTHGTTAAVPITPDPEVVDAYILEAHPDGRGTWSLRVTLRGTLGTGAATLAMPVDGPPVLPTWLGWLIGLAPLAGLAAFASTQARWLRHARSQDPVHSAA